MTESRILTGQRDRSVIDANDPIDVNYVHYQFPWLSHQQIKEIIQKHGPDRDSVYSVLERGGTRKDSEE